MHAHIENALMKFGSGNENLQKLLPAFLGDGLTNF